MILLAAPVRKTITLVLCIILLVSTFTSFYNSSSSSFIRNAQAEPYYYNEADDNKNFNSEYSSSHVEDSDNKDISLNKIKCINDNININGINSGNVTFGNNGKGYSDAYSSNDNRYQDRYDNNNNKQGKGFDDCVINNDNTNTNITNSSSNSSNQTIQGATLSINKEWFFCNNDDIDCIIEPQEEGEQISFEGPTSGNYTQCTSDEQCPFANDAGFNITVNGSNPIPNTIPAQINTQQQVEIGAGSFTVTEELFSDRFVPNANFDVENVPVEDLLIPSNVPNPLIIVFDEVGQRVFTANYGSNSVSIIDLTTTPPSVTNVDLSASGGISPRGIVFDEEGQRVFTADETSNSVSIIDLTTTPPSVTNVDLSASGAIAPRVITFDEGGQRVFTANTFSDSVSVIDLTTTPPSVTDIDLSASGGTTPLAIAFDATGQRVFTADFNSNSISVIDLTTTPPSVTDVDLSASGGTNPVAIAFDATGQRVFTANLGSNSLSVIDLTTTPPSVTDVDLSASGGTTPFAIAFDATGQRVFTANVNSDSVSVIDLTTTPITVIDVDLSTSGGNGPRAIVFDATGQVVFTANTESDSVSIIDLTTTPITVTDVDLSASGGDGPFAITVDETDQRAFTANEGSNSVSIISKPTVSKICQDSGFDTGDIRTFVSGQQTFEQITCVNFVGQCSGDIENGETRECTVEDYVVSLEEVPTDGDGIGILSSNMDNSIQQQGNQPIDIQQQRTEDSSALTAMEKINKLKTQWLNQLP